MPRVRLPPPLRSTAKKRRLTAAPRRAAPLASEANKALCKFQHSSKESMALGRGKGGGGVKQIEAGRWRVLIRRACRPANGAVGH